MTKHANKERITAIMRVLQECPEIIKTIWKKLKKVDQASIINTYCILDYTKPLEDRGTPIVTVNELANSIINHPFDAWFDATGQYVKLREFIEDFLAKQVD